MKSRAIYLQPNSLLGLFWGDFYLYIPYEPNSFHLKMEAACSFIYMYDPVWCIDPEDPPITSTLALKDRKISLYVVCKVQGMPGTFYLIHWCQN
jgi:hypothetical protein